MFQVFDQYISAKTLLLIALEVALMAVAIVFGVKLRFWTQPSEFDSYIQNPVFSFQVVLIIAVFQLCFYYRNLYDFRAVSDRPEELARVGQSIGSASLLLGLVYFLFPFLLLGRGVYFISTGLIAVFVLVSRVVLDRAWHFAAPPQHVLVLGTQDLGLTVARELRRRSDLNLKLIGFVSAAHSSAVSELADYPVFGNASQLEQVVEQQKVSRIVIALEEQRGALPIRELVKLRVQGVHVEDAHAIISSLTGRVWLNTVRPSWFVFSNGFHRSRVTLFVKRTLDILLALAVLVLAAPLFIIVLVAVKLDSKGPILYRQVRIGFKGRSFEILKFRSMCTEAEIGTGAQWAVRNDPRVTRVGAFIRKYRLDELPQAINILRGEMSFIGPRPERPFFVEQLRPQINYYDERHSVRPGLTGWAQVQYGYGSSMQDALRKLEYDLFYLKHLSLVFDCIILLKTIRIVLSGSGGH